MSFIYYGSINASGLFLFDRFTVLLKYLHKTGPYLISDLCKNLLFLGRRREVSLNSCHNSCLDTGKTFLKP